MKAPAELSNKLARQWENSDLRESRILDHPDAWPVRLSIGRPSPSMVRNHTADVKAHFDKWTNVRVGEVSWAETNYKATGQTVRYPNEWIIADVLSWVRASDQRLIQSEYDLLNGYLEAADSLFHSLLVRRRALWRGRAREEVEATLQLAALLEPASGGGAPLRSHPQLEGLDSKFFERNEAMLVALLDLRFDGEVSRQGLAVFLGSLNEKENWLLVADLDGGLLPFERLRLTSAMLAERELPCSHLLVVENERCLHLLPKLTGTIAVLGTGFDIGWLAASWVRERSVAYWGDIDSWGLEILARVRQSLPEVTALLMTKATLLEYSDRAVVEPASTVVSSREFLREEEFQLLEYLQARDLNRLEQEFIKPIEVHKAVVNWSLTKPRVQDG